MYPNVPRFQVSSGVVLLIHFIALESPLRMELRPVMFNSQYSGAGRSSTEKAICGAVCARVDLLMGSCEQWVHAHPGQCDA